LHSWQTNGRLADAYELKLTPLLRKDQINFVSLTTSKNSKISIYDLNIMGWNCNEFSKRG
jgi:hypothetical protein